MTAPITVYITRPAAPLCERVCDFLDRRGYAYTTVDIVTEVDREKLRRETGHSSCPVVVAAGRSSAGCKTPSKPNDPVALPH